jgi:hypothetical protein
MNKKVTAKNFGKAAILKWLKTKDLCMKIDMCCPFNCMLAKYGREVLGLKNIGVGHETIFLNHGYGEQNRVEIPLKLADFIKDREMESGTGYLTVGEIIEKLHNL